MRRPVLMAVLLTIALACVIYGKYRLDQGIKEGVFNTEPAGTDAGTQPAGALQTPTEAGVETSRPEQSPLGAGDEVKSTEEARSEVLSALVTARETVRLKDKVAGEAGVDAHATPNTILRSAEVLGALISLEQSHPEAKAEFQAFYQECAKDSEVITVTRVQCLEKYIISKELSPDQTKALLATTDPLVAKLYREMQP